MKKLILEFLKWMQLRSRAKSLKFPMSVKDKYIYAAGLDLGYRRYKTWVAFANEHNLDRTTFFPMFCNGDAVATYRLARSYFSSGNSMSDLACGDSGKNGDFELERIDEMSPTEP
jgi:hypothetical protein